LIKNKILCEEDVTSKIDRKLKAISHIERNRSIFESKYLIDRDNLEKIKLNTMKIKSQLAASKVKLNCVDSIPDLSKIKVNGTSRARLNFTKKLHHYFDLSVLAYKYNITRSITFNLHNFDVHHNSHYAGKPDNLAKYLGWTEYFNSLIADFSNKLKAEGLFDDTLIYTNAGSSMSSNVHNYNNQSIYVINGKQAGVFGSPGKPTPPGSLLLDILRKYNINYTEFGGSNHRLGVGKPLGYI